MVNPDPVGSHVPNSVVLLNDGVDAPAAEAVRATAITTRASGAQSRALTRITIPLRIGLASRLYPRYVTASQTDSSLPVGEVLRGLDL
jgi:hypothetical protein